MTKKDKEMTNQLTNSQNATGWTSSLSSISSALGAVLTPVATMYTANKQAEVAKAQLSNPFNMENNRILLLGGLGLAGLLIWRRS